MKNFLFITLLSLSCSAMAQDIPQAFHGKWTGGFPQIIMQPQVIKAMCNSTEKSSDSNTMLISKNQIRLHSFAEDEVIGNFNFRKITKKRFIMTAKVTKTGNLELLHNKSILSRNIDMSFTDNNNELLELFNDKNDRENHRFWYRCQ